MEDSEGPGRNLLVQAYGTGIPANCELVGKNQCRATFLVDLDSIDESLFWGERKLEELGAPGNCKENAFDMSLIFDMSFDEFSSDSTDDDLDDE